MKRINNLLLASLFASTFLLSGCNQGWKPGKNAIEGAEQPTLKNPKAELSDLNKIRISQNSFGLPSKGKANILVVPITFYGDSLLEGQTGIDLTFNQADLVKIKNTYFGENNVTYPSLSDYYQRSSYGKLTISGVVTPTITYKENFLSLIDNITYGTKTVEGVHNEIIDYVYQYLFVTTKTYNLDHFDSNKDGKIDSIQILVNYPYGIGVGESNMDLVMSEFLDYDNIYFSKDISSETPINSYSVTSELLVKGAPTNLFARVPIYQTGLMLGLDDYADTTGNQDSIFRATMGRKDMMDGFVGDHSSFSKYQLGWITPTLIKASDIDDDGLTLTLNRFSESGQSIVLYNDTHSCFDEYLMLDLFSPTGLNSYDDKGENPLGSSLYSLEGLRLTHVDARLIRGYGKSFFPYNDALNFDEEITLSNNEKVKYVYDYRHTNNYLNNYSSYGITSNNPLCLALSKNALNRHATSNIELNDNDLFLQGDSFGLEGFYKDFTFYEGDELGITFEVNKIKDNQATITLRRAK
ncbi:MAG: hypothetical protein IKB70_07145 [Bacilli bacterium]|nr:hypothetical protein [Bacilli bacterium]